MNVKQFMNNINFPKDLSNDVLEIKCNDNVVSLFKEFLKGNEEAGSTIKSLFPNNSHLVWLNLYFTEALHTYEKYKKIGIDDEIFYDTMAIFTRSVLENEKNTGTAFFNIEGWTYRQINMNIFRIGLLEYELYNADSDIYIDGNIVIKKGEEILSIHIPSDVIITREELDESYSHARIFMSKYFPKYKDSKFVCYTWLLSTDLNNLLPATSRLSLFRDDYTIIGTSEDESYHTWLFGNKEEDPSKYIEKTSLQLAVKNHLICGGKIRNSTGVILNK